MHGVRVSLLDQQMERLGIPCHKVYIPAPCPNEIYEKKMHELTDTLKADGITHVIFGDLFLEDVRDYIQKFWISHSPGDNLDLISITTFLKILILAAKTANSTLSPLLAPCLIAPSTLRPAK